MSTRFTKEFADAHNARVSGKLTAPLRQPTIQSVNAYAYWPTNKEELNRLELHPLTDEQIYKLVLPYPPSANAYWRSIVINGKVRVLVSKEAKEYKKLSGTIARRLFPRPLAGAIGMQLRVYRPEKRGDLSNRIKVLEDTLIGIAYEDDSQIVEIRAYRHDSPRDGKVEVSIWQL